MAKSFSRYVEVSIEKKNDKAVIEKHRATNDEMAKILKAGSFSRIGLPLCSLRPPGTVAEVVSATLAMSAATTKHDSEVLDSHSWPSFTSSLCVFVKISFGVLPLLLYPRKKYRGIDSLTNCDVQNI